MIDGGSVNLTCVAVGSPMPYVRWRRGSVDVPSVAGQLDASTPIGKNVLQLTDVRQTTTYTCVASSELGSIEHHAEVRVRGRQNQLRLIVLISKHTYLGYRTDCDCAQNRQVMRLEASLLYHKWNLCLLVFKVIYSVSQPPPPRGFLTFFPNGLEFLINFLHTYYTFISTLVCKFLFNYLQI